MIRVLALTICLLCAFTLGGAMAAEAEVSDGLEFVPFVGRHHFGGSFDEASIQRPLEEEQGGWGFTLSSTPSQRTRYEFLYSHQDARLTDKTSPEDAFDLDVHYLHLGGTLDFVREGFVPFFSGGIGMTRLNPGHGGYDNETRLSLSLGGGLKWYPTERLDIRFEMRSYSTLLDSNSDLFCGGGCELQLSSDLFPQFETNLGLIFRF